MFAKYFNLPSSRILFAGTRSLVIPHSFAPIRHFRMVSTTLPRKPIFAEIAKHDPNSIAIVQSEDGKIFTYGQLLKDVAASKQSMLDVSKAQKLDGERVAFMVENGYDYVGRHSHNECYLLQEHHANCITLSSHLPGHPCQPSHCTTPISSLPQSRARIHLERLPSQIGPIVCKTRVKDARCLEIGHPVIASLQSNTQDHRGRQQQ